MIILQLCTKFFENELEKSTKAIKKGILILVLGCSCFCMNIKTVGNCRYSYFKNLIPTLGQILSHKTFKQLCLQGAGPFL